jgi:hypothetical protein
MLTQLNLKSILFYNPETGIFTWLKPTMSRLKIGDIAGRKNNKKGMRIGICKKDYLSHRLAWLYVHGKWPNGVIDHIDGNPFNNSIDNLRDVSRTVNQQNQKKSHSNSKSGFLGVTDRKTRFDAHIVVNGKQKFLGSYKTKEEAYHCYLIAKRELHPGCTI